MEKLLLKRLACVVAVSSVALLSSSCAVLVPTAAITAGGMLALDERSSGAVVDDALLITKIKTELSRHGFNALFAKISVNSYEGRVMLTGTLGEYKHVKEAVRLAWSVQGVKEVINELVVAPRPKNQANDLWISSKIKAKFLVEKNFDSLNYKYDVNDGVVYLLGVAQDKAELEKALAIVGSISKVEKVVTHVILKTDQRRKV